VQQKFGYFIKLRLYNFFAKKKLTGLGNWSV